ncbi:MAG: type II toxin-antitoxin system RelE/ParE family toxin [Oligoflexales bacterium]
MASGQTIGMPASKPMTSAASGVYELRIKDRSGQFRVFYISKHVDAILVFHAFKKKTQATPKQEIQVAKNRLKDMI